MILIIGLVVIADRIAKLLAIKYLKGIATFPIIENVFHLTYSENTGAAFSMFSGKAYLLGIFSLAVVCFGFLFYLSQKKKNPAKKLYLLSLIMILSGAIGNLIDRFIYGFVVDFFDFCLINFAIFNVADCFITVGCAIMVVCLIFDRDIVL